MRVLLWKDIEKVGKIGDIVDVADGFARNYLLPRKLATKPTKGLIKAVEQEKLRQQKRELKKIEEAKVIANKIEEIFCTIEVKATPDGTLYGSVTERAIVDELAKENITVDTKMIELPEHIKETGIYHIKINLTKDIAATLKLWVVEEATND